MEWWHGLVLGIVEGLTEFLPVSSTGHLILTSRWMGLEGESVKTFEIVIQSGAMVAVLALYRRRVLAMWQGVMGRDEAGRRLLVRLLISVFPALLAGAALHHWIKERLFTVTPVIGALAAGGIVMVVLDRWLRRRAEQPGKAIESLTATDALLIGLMQCLALWPGTSRAMATILGGLLIGLPATAAAEYSFLLALPTLGAATCFDLIKGGEGFVRSIGPAALLCGFVASAVVAALAIRGFIRYLTHHGFAVFGWYRIALAALVWVVVR